MLPLKGKLPQSDWSAINVHMIPHGGEPVVLTIRRFYESETTDDCPVPEGPPPATAECIEFDEWTLDRP